MIRELHEINFSLEKMSKVSVHPIQTMGKASGVAVKREKSSFLSDFVGTGIKQTEKRALMPLIVELKL